MDQPIIFRRIIMNTFKTCSLISSIIFLTHCGSSGRVVEKKANGEYQPDHGPFDSKGNYIESWADNPPKRTYKRSSKRSSTRKSSSRTSKKPTSTSKKSYRTSKSKSNRKKSSTYKKPTNTRKKSTPKKIVPKTKPPIMHTVRKGDTVYGLARKFGASPNAIIKANNIRNGMIKIGQKLIIPRK